ncbi:MAG TPA: ComEC/Rec2 family competence protein, partial [Marisediminicola sp.]|nr:ComEC/Rec2 family competence protein [Marisediminicola sp.]
LWPPSRLGGIEPGNDASVALAFEGVGECGDGCLGSVFLGDLGEQSQSLMLATSRMAAADVVKVAHHGSADQDARLYERLNSRVGLVGVGADNGYGHPAPRLLNLLAAGGTTVARTDSMGLVLVAPGPDDSVVMWSERG